MTDLLPLPRVVDLTGGSFELAPGAAISGDGELVDGLRAALSVLDLRIVDGGGAVTVRRDPGLGAEAYTLTVDPGGVRVTAADRAGAFYAGQTLRQLLPPDAYRSVRPRTPWTIPGVRVEDAPRCSWRGMHLDVARHFLPKQDVLRHIDIMAAHKLNILHLHLVDDQGWRVESRAYPKLHEVGSHRPRTISSYYGEEVTYDEVPHGGRYTLADLAEIAEYARSRSVTVVPEIDVPGHASALVAAYPQYGARPQETFPVLDRWGISPTILSPLPATVDFLTTVLDEVAGALGGAPFFHIGGDECVLDDWAASAEIDDYRRSLGLDTPAELHAWFLRRLADELAGRGTRAVVWDEAFVSGELRADTVVMPWRGMGVARRVAAAGYDVVITPVFPLYFDYGESDGAEEPLAIGAPTTLADVAAFEVIPESWTAAERARVLGAQAQHWSERIPDARTLDYRAWPRGAALAEITWHGRPADLTGRLGAHLARLDALGVEYRPPQGPRPWQRGGIGRRRHRPGVVNVVEMMRHVEEMTNSADSTRPSM
ncbi:beta-N-acetylhexosaminidase [Spongiactinospora sp. TRM90649]|uniref:beta-N-acetylhexosaminidase n=1 Tax=Spongiactinospora sp. TRM90649 TaxID=3031114 RepID=UPI0023F99511|nr:beta-N-acetylhexosaminidase [Spongiactinospora sp. TRM90649]MDF5754475.1 beta-N-acetylhexosaminidase [Spongiactinospora sp. TRM90649]